MSDLKNASPAENRLASICFEISTCSSLNALTRLTATAARELTKADGATFIIRDEDLCYYCDEDAISPLWKGKRFPMHTCISGWAMLNKQVVIIEDIFIDGRVPIEAYKPTFVKSLLMIPIDKGEPVGALGIYWAKKHIPLISEIKTLQILADANAEVLKKLR